MPASRAEAKLKSRLWKPGWRFEPMQGLKWGSGNPLQMDFLTGPSAPQLYSQLQAPGLHPTATGALPSPRLQGKAIKSFMLQPGVIKAQPYPLCPSHSLGEVPGMGKPLSRVPDAREQWAGGRKLEDSCLGQRLTLKDKGLRWRVQGED